MTCAPARDVDEPRVVGHAIEFRAADHPGRLRGECEGEDHRIRVPKRVGERIGANDVGHPVHRRRATAHDGDVDAERRKQWEQCLGDAPAAQDRHLAVVEAPPGLAGPLGRPHPLG